MAVAVHFVISYQNQNFADTVNFRNSVSVSKMNPFTGAQSSSSTSIDMEPDPNERAIRLNERELYSSDLAAQHTVSHCILFVVLSLHTGLK